MTFEGFDAAPLIDAAGFSPDMPAIARAASDDSGTLDAALREAARVERAAARAELFAADLWIGHSDARGLGASERPGLEAGTSWRALMPLLDEALLELPGGKDGPLRAAYGEKEGGGEGEKPEEEIIVKGTRPDKMDDGDALDGIPGGDKGIDAGGELIGGSGIEGEETSNDCRDRQALEAKVAIRAEGDRDTHEHGVIVYRGADGQVHRSALIQGTPESVDPDHVFQWLRDNGISVSQVIGFVHNHPAWQYGRSDGEALINRYPSGNDWSFAQTLVAAGAGGPSGDNFALYLIDTAGKLREFEYDDRAMYQSLTQSDKERNEALPDETESDGSSCG